MFKKIVRVAANRYGYFTPKDTCGALALIGDIYKTEVYELARFINREKEIESYAFEIEVF